MTATTSLQRPAAVESAEQPQAMACRPSVRDLVRVIVRPISTLRLQRSSGDTARLVLLVVALDFLVSLLLIPTLFHELQASWATIPNVTVSAKVTSLGVAIIAGTLINTLLIIIVASLCAMLLYVLNRRLSFADLVGTLIVASVPLMLDRFGRACAFYVSVDSAAWREMVSIGGLTGLTAKGLLGEIAHFFTIFDLWSAILIVVALGRVSRSNVVVAAGLMALSWGSLQYLLFQLYAAGYFR
jgi:hypothetical protein